MYIHRYDEVSLLLMAELARKYGHGRVSLSQVSQSHGISVPFLKKIARTLRQNNLVVSKEGVSGGYELSRSPVRINLWDIVSSFSVKHKNEKSELSGSCPIRKNCLPQQVHNTIDRMMVTGLSSVKLSEII